MKSVRNHWKARIMLFFVSQCVTLLGSQIVQMAIVWHVTLTTGSGAWVAAFSLGAYLPQFFVSFLGGVWADRFSRKRLILGADLLTAAAALAMVLLMPRIGDGTALLTALLLMSALRSACAGIQNPAVSAVVTQLADEGERMRYNGIYAAMQSAVQFAAPAAAALALSAGTLRAVMMIDITTAALGVGLLACIDVPRVSGEEENASAVIRMKAGIRYAVSARTVRRALIVYGWFLFWSVPAGYLAGLFVSRAYGESYGYLTAVELVGFGGMMAGGLLMSLRQGFRDRRMTLGAGLLFFGIMACAMAASRRFVWYLVFMALYGVALTVVQTTIMTMLQENTEEAMQGRVFGLMSALYAGGYPAGMALFGPMADAVPLRLLMILSGAALMASAAFVWGDVHRNP